ncbi:MAG: hypothetical protein WKF37_16540 [Bryobacteraceae bacterium]
MPEEVNGHNSPSRLDRIEGIVEALASSQMGLVDSQKHLLTAQVILQGEMTKMAASHRELAAAQKHADETVAHLSAKIDALVNVADELVRRQKPE